MRASAPGSASAIISKIPIALFKLFTRLLTQRGAKEKSKKCYLINTVDDVSRTEM